MMIINTIKEFILRELKKDYAPYLILSLPMLFLIIFLVWPLGSSIGKAFILRGQELSFDNFTFANFQRFFTSSIY